jgi:L-amino acid N-acyltransferase YncA
MPLPVSVRVATELDLAAVAAIYGREVREGVATFDEAPPTPDTWLAKLRSIDPGDHFLVAEAEGSVVGYAYSTAYRTRTAYRHTRETTVYVSPDAVGQGVGRALYDDLLARLRADGMRTALAAIALPNPASQALHEQAGFEHLGTMREVGFKFGRWIDVGWWQLLLGATSDTP